MKPRTSITITPPAPVQQIAVPLLRQYAYDLPRRLPAHITVLYPFVPVPALPDAVSTLRELCADVPPFSVTLDGYGAFPGVLYMNVMPNPALAHLMQQVGAAFPKCIPYDGMFDAHPVPHVTIGVFSSQAKQNTADLPPYPAQTFPVDRVSVAIGDDDLIIPWLVQDVIYLGG
jgi:2'-5' RNA ligase